MKLQHIFSNQSEQQTPHRERKYLSLIESPLEVEEKNPRTHAGERHQLNVQQSSKAENAPDTGTPLEYSDTINGNGSAKLDNQVAPLPPTSSQPNNPLQWSNNIDGGDGSTQQDEKPHESRREQRREQQPHFRAHHEASSIELFYDLFFVANLATFTTNYPIDDKASLGSYMGFFSVLWFTWFQTSLYNVRFSIDSVFSRVCKALHFGVMTGFAIVDPTFDTQDIEGNSSTFRSLSLILMVSRLILVLQYGTVLWFVKDYKKTTLPVALIMAILLFSAMIFLGITFAIGPDKGAQADIGWYVTSVVEAILVLRVSAQWRILSFKRTHLIERVGLLTMIILGEGIIGMTKSVTDIMRGVNDVTSSSIGMVICSVLIIYFLYMIYYDQIDRGRFGTIRQQVWAALHFPLHVFILLTVEGSSQFILWHLGVELMWGALNNYTAALNNAYNSQQVIDAINSTTIAISGRLTDRYPAPNFTVQYANLTALHLSNSSSNATLNQAIRLVEDIEGETIAWIFKSIGITVPAKELAHTKTALQKIAAIGDVFAAVFVYFFSSAGLVLVLLSVMHWFGKKNKSRGELASIMVRFWIGVALALLAVMHQSDMQMYGRYVESPWILPTVTFAYAIVISLDNFFIYLSHRHLSQAKRDYDVRVDTVA